MLDFDMTIGDQIAALSDAEIDALAGKTFGMEPAYWVGSSEQGGFSGVDFHNEPAAKRGCAEYDDAIINPAWPRYSTDPAASAQLCQAAQALDWAIEIELRKFGCFVRVATPPHTNDPYVGTNPWVSKTLMPYRAIATAIVEKGVETGRVKLEGGE